MSKGRSLALKRISKDIKEINQNPIEGIGISSIENDPMKYVVNIKLMTGPYKAYCIQLLLTFPDSYPSKPPKMLIYPDQAIDGQYHHHIFGDFLTDENNHYFKKFCFDLLDNDFMSTKDENSGWNPSYTISSILLQVQNFISDPDMPGFVPQQYQIKQLFDSMKTYKRKFRIINEQGKEEIIVHTWQNPFPKMYEKKEEQKEEKEDEITQKEKIRIQQIKDNLTCFMLKINYIDDMDILLGYPIIQNQLGLMKQKIELYPIPELLTYEGYMAQIGKQDDKLDFYFDIKFKSANNQYYNYWVPIYIDEYHYKKNRTAILNSFSVIKYGPLGIKEYDFQPQQIFEILPIILNKMIIGMFNGKSSICSSFIRCYFQYVLLFKRLCLEFENEYLDYVNKILNEVKNNGYNPDKKIIPDIGNFFMLLFFSNKNTNNEKMKKIWYILFEEFAIRQSYWIFHEVNNKNKIIQIIKDYYYKSDLYESFQIEELLPKLDGKTLQELLDYVFESQRGNKLLIITFFTRKKIENKEFMKELQDNYGIYLEVDTFIKEMNQQLKNIKNYKEFFNYIGSEFGKDMNDLDILIHCYKKAKEKEYIREPNRNNNYQFNRGGRGGYFRGYRGGFGGYRGDFGGYLRGNGRGRGRGNGFY